MARCLWLMWMLMLGLFCGESEACRRVWYASDDGDKSVLFSSNLDILTTAYIDKEYRYPQMNVRPIPREAWLTVDKDYDAQIALKRMLYGAFPEKHFRTRGVHKAETEAAARELLLMVAEQLCAVHPDRFKRQGDYLMVEVAGEWEKHDVVNPKEPALSIVGKIVQEDILMLRPDSRGVYKLETGLTVFPSNWDLKDFMGLSVDGIHSAVDRYAETLGSRVNGMIANLRPGLTFARNNFFIYEYPMLAVRRRVDYSHSGPEITLGNVGELLYFRTEFETFVKLPESGYVVFTIKPHVYPMATLVEHPEVGRKLLHILEHPELHDFPYQSLLIRYFRKNLRPSRN